MRLPIGAGAIESAIRRVINLRLKSPGSFWDLDFAKKKNNWGKALAQDFINLVTYAAPSTPKGII